MNEAQTIDEVAHQIIRLRLQLPALFLLDVGKPLTFIGGQLLWVLQPAASLFVPSTQLSQWAKLLESPAALSKLQQRLRQATH